MDSNGWRKDARPSPNEPPRRVRRSARVSPSASDRHSTPQTDVPTVRPPTPKRSYAAIAGDSKSPTPSKVTVVDSAVPVRSTTTSDAQSQRSRPPGQRPTRQGNQSAGGGPPLPPRGGSDNRIGFHSTSSWDRKTWGKPTFLPGTIISARHYEEHIEYVTPCPVSPNNPPSSPWLSSLATEPTLCPFSDPRGGQVCCKQRLMVVIHAFHDHYVAVPIFSYGGKGLSEKPAAKKAEHLDIHDHRNPNNISQNNLPALKTKNMQSWTDNLIPGSVVYYTYPVSIYYKRKVGLIGDLTEDSTALLKTYYYHHVVTRRRSTSHSGGTSLATISDVDMADP